MVRDKVLGSEEMSALIDPYETCVEQLFATSRNYFIHPLQFDANAGRIRRQLEEKHMQLVQTFLVINKRLASHIGKYDGMFASYCLLWHVIEHPPEEWSGAISEDIARRVASFMHDFLLPHAIAFYRSIFALADEHERLTAVAGYILAHKLERLTNRDIQRGVRSMRNCDRRDIESVCNQLDTFGWVTRVSGRKFTDAPTWIVNPIVHEKFKEYAEWEMDQRQRAQQLMAETISSEMSVTEIARHESGYVLWALPGKLTPPKLQLKLMRPEPVKKRLGESARIWLTWDTDKLELDRLSSTALADEPEEVEEWVINVLRRRQ